jgi:hypothetical protein
MRLSITILMLLLLSGCSGMLLGADVAPAEQEDTEEDEESRKDE